METITNEPTAYRHDLKTCTANEKGKTQTIYKLTTHLHTVSAPIPGFIPHRPTPN